MEELIIILLWIILCMCIFLFGLILKCIIYCFLLVISVFIFFFGRVKELCIDIWVEVLYWKLEIF